jgi:2'-5' RNA ligase
VFFALWPVEESVLVESELTRSGANYCIVGRWRLG